MSGQSYLAAIRPAGEGRFASFIEVARRASQIPSTHAKLLRTTRFCPIFQEWGRSLRPDAVSHPLSRIVSCSRPIRNWMPPSPDLLATSSVSLSSACANGPISSDSISRILNDDQIIQLRAESRIECVATTKEIAAICSGSGKTRVAGSHEILIFDRLAETDEAGVSPTYDLLARSWFNRNNRSRMSNARPRNAVEVGLPRPTFMVAPTGQPPADQSEPQDESGRPDSNGNNPRHRQASPWRVGVLLRHDHQNGCYPHSAQDHPHREQKALYPVHLIPPLSLSEQSTL